MTNKDDLLELKEKIDKASLEISKLNGKKELLEKQLKDSFGCSSLEEAKDKLKKLEGQIEKLDEQIKLATKELNTQYDLPE